MSKIPKVVSFERPAAYLHHRAMMNRRDNHNIDALELLRRAVEAQPDNSEYRLDLAEMYCEMGCHEQSARLLLDMLSEEDPPSDCYYGLAMNQLGMNDLAGAKQSLSVYRRREPKGMYSEEVHRLTEELQYYTASSRPASRRLNRALNIANRACDAMREGNVEKARRLFERTLTMASEQFEMRALYAMALLMTGDNDAARREADRAAEAFPPSVRAMGVCAQVYHALGDDDRALALLRRCEEEHPAGLELRLLLFTAGELGRHERVAEYARLALQETPYDRQLLHCRAVGLLKSGADAGEAARCWERILRLDPEDGVAQFYSDAAAGGALDVDALEYGYEVPEAEYRCRMETFSKALETGFEGVREQWSADAAFRALVRWAAQSDSGSLGRGAVTVLATLEDGEAVSTLRGMMFAPFVSRDIKLHAALMLKLQGRSISELLPRPLDSVGEALVDTEALLSGMPVGDRQLVRYADEVLEAEYGVSARPVLALMWVSYRRMRGTRGDPLKRVDAAAGALACNYLMAAGEKPDIGRLSRAFGCPPRQLTFYASRIAERLVDRGMDFMSASEKETDED